MEFHRIQQIIADSDARRDWRLVERGGIEIRFYIHDVNLRFECDCTEDKHADPFNEFWAVNFPDTHAVSYYHNIYYGQTLVEQVILVSVDGGRAVVPIPQLDTMEISRYKYKIAEIHDTLGGLDEAMNRSGIKLRGPG